MKSEYMDSILGKTFPVLDKGIIRVIDYMGVDESIVQAARVSYGTGTKSVNEDKTLIKYLLQHKHTSPFEQCSIKLHLKMPIFIARQWVRHRTAKMNEYSARYSVVKDDFYIPELEQIRFQNTVNKQGSGESLEEANAKLIQNQILIHSSVGYSLYEHLLNKGLSRELARMVLPLNVYTEFYWKIDLHNLLHFLTLRCDSHAQYEIRVYAEKILEIVKNWVPYTHEAYLNCIVDGATFTKAQLNVIKDFIDYKNLELEQILAESKLSIRDKNHLRGIFLKNE